MDCFFYDLKVEEGDVEFDVRRVVRFCVFFAMKRRFVSFRCFVDDGIVI